MSALDLPVILAPEALESLLGREGLLVVDLCQESTYTQYHVPGAVHIDYQQIVAISPPVHGLLPETADLERLFSATGISSCTHVIAYDDEGGGKASRLLWTLEVLGHKQYSLLDGGLYAWANEGHQLDAGAVTPEPATFTANYSTEAVADAGFILKNLDSSDLALIDARGEDEFAGRQITAQRNGHIPGAVHWNWQDIMDPLHNQRLKSTGVLEQALAERGVAPDKQVVVYCQTNHRSSLTYITLRSLGYERVKAYPGSWSDWGNREDTPVEK